MVEKSAKGKKKLRRSIIGAMILSMALIYLVLVNVGFFVYRDEVIKEHEEYAGDAIEYISRGIDGEVIQKYIDTKMETYATAYIRKTLNMVVKTHHLEAVYIVVPREDSVLRLIMSNDTDLSSFFKKTMDHFNERMDNRRIVTYVRDETRMSDKYTAVRPLFDEHGNPIALICADVHIGNIGAAFVHFSFYMLVAMLGLSIVIIGVMYWWLGKRIALPLSRLQDSIIEFENKFYRGSDPSELLINDPEIHTKDELETLWGYISSLADDVRRYAIDISKKTDEFEDMREQVKEMDEIAFTDSLTGGENKAAYVKAMEHLDWEISIKIARFAIIMADLNYLKRTNDTYGHEKGNMYIIYNYNLLRRIFRYSKIYRIGGDEFVIILKDKGLHNLGDNLQKLQEEMQSTWEDESLQPWERLSSAIGCAVYDPSIDHSAEDVFERADEAMYAEKKRMHAGRE